MEKTALLVEFVEGRPKEANFGPATLVHRSGRQPLALVVGASAAQAEAALEPLGRYGVRQVAAIRAGAPGRPPGPAAAARAVVAAMAHFGVTQLVGLTTPRGRDLLPRIAARLDAPLVMDCIEVDLARRVVRTTQYSGKTIATIRMRGAHFVFGLRPNAVAAEKAPGAAELLEFTAPDDGDDGLEVIETRPGAGEGQNLAEADVILSGGRGMRSGENFKLLFDCARRIPNAAVGASRVAVDSGWVPYGMQVGQTGVKVNPKVYIACGISGSVQHFAGMKSSGMIIALNTDPNAAIASKCDYYAVADLFEVLAELEKQLAEPAGGDAPGPKG